MASIFRPELILHIEDEGMWRREINYTISGSEEIQKVYGGQIIFVESQITSEVQPNLLENEIKRIESQIGNDRSALVSVITAQVAREFLGKYLPGVIISDTSFPLNGKKVVQWIQSKGYNDYALIGLSGTSFKDLDEELKEWFGKSNARYFDKKTVFNQTDEFLQQIIRNKEDNTRRYSGK